MTSQRAHGLLRGLLLVLGAVAVLAGLYTALTGAAGMPGDSEATANVDSELRFYSVFWAAFGALALIAARAPATKVHLIRGLALFLFIGGLARALGWAVDGRPDAQFLVLLALELGLPPVMLFLQQRLSRPRST